MGSDEKWPADFDPASPQAHRAAVRLAFNVLLQAPHPADFSTTAGPARSYLEEYRRWHEEQLRPLREVLFELVQASGDTPPTEAVH